MTNQLHKGDVVRDCMGHTWTVSSHIGTTVYVYDGFGKTIHRTKCTKVADAAEVAAIDFF